MIRDRQGRSDEKQHGRAAGRRREMSERAKLLEHQARKAEQALRAAREPQD